jgi:chromosomal replication initiation ATPase DnaA
MTVDFTAAAAEPRRRYPGGAYYYSHADRKARGWLLSSEGRTYPVPTAAKRILAMVAAEYGTTVKLLVSHERRLALSAARWDAMARLRAVIRTGDAKPLSLPQIGFILGGRDHSTIKHGLAKWAEIQAKSIAKREAEAA